MMPPIVKGALWIEGRGRKPGSQNPDTSRRLALIADVAASDLNTIEAAIEVHPAYYGKRAIEAVCEQRREQLAYLRKEILKRRKSIPNI